MNNFGLPERTINELLTYFNSNPEIKAVKIYGSRAKGTFHNGSDIDLAVWLADGNKLSSVKAALEELPTPYKFDIVNYETLADNTLKTSIDNDGISIY